MNWSHPAFALIAKQLKARTGLHFSERRREEAEQGIRRAMQRANQVDLDRFAAIIASDERAVDDLVVELAVTESYFFREPRQFEMIRHEALPEIRRRMGDDHQIRAWSAGCAAGEEPYSLAIVLDQQGLAERARVLATDISRPALGQARQGIYDAWSVRDNAFELARGGLRRRDGQYEIDERLRRLVTFQYLNLAIDLYPSELSGTSGLDLILCRNVLLYFDQETIAAVARRLFDCLSPGGWLVTASTDPLLGEMAPYEMVSTSAGAAYRRPVDPPSVACAAKDEVPVIAVPSDRDREVSLTRGTALLPAERKSPRAADNRLEAAQAAYTAGDYALSAKLAGQSCTQPTGYELRVRSMANFDPVLAERTCAAAVVRYPLSAPLHYLHGVLLIGQGRDKDAIDALRQVTFLDRSQPLAHFTLGSVLQRRGDLLGARRAYRIAQQLCEALPPDARVSFSEGERAGRLAEAAAARIAELDSTQEPKE